MNLGFADALRVRAEGHVEQQVVAGVGEQRRVQQRVVADVARQTHPVRARPVGGSTAEEGRRLADAQLERRWLLDPGAGVQSQLRRKIVHPVLQQRELVGRRDDGGGSASSGLVGLAWNEAITIRSGRSPCVTVTRRVDIERPSRTRSTDEIEGLLGSAGLDEVRVQGLRVLAGARSRSRRARAWAIVCPPKTRSKRPGSLTDSEAIVAQRLELERSQQSVERDEDRLLEGSVSSARCRQAGGLGAHGEMASTSAAGLVWSGTTTLWNDATPRGCRRC